MLFSELLVTCAGLGFSIFLFVVSGSFPQSTQAGVPSAAFFPQVVAVIIFGLSGAQLARTLVTRIRNGNGAEKEAVANKRNIIHIVEVLLLVILYCLLWKYNIGHYVINSIVIFIPIAMIFGGSTEREWWKTCIFIVVLVAFIYCLFKFVLRVAF
jgi:hypothetical protein